MTRDFVTRFAPSPTGRLHLGHAFSALSAFETARVNGGRFLLRIEDIDEGRCRPDFVEGIFEDLAWLGIAWEEPVRAQSAYLQDYADVLDDLRQHRLIYPCFCTRREIAAEIARSPSAPHGPDGPLYPGVCREIARPEAQNRIEKNEPHAWRFDTAAAIELLQTRDGWPLHWREHGAGKIRAEPERLGDVVLARKDVPTSYHLAVTVDDHLQGVTHVVRGADLRHTTHVHRTLQALLGYDPPAYAHHPLLTDENGRRYAKRDKALTLQALRAAGKSPADVRAMMPPVEAFSWPL